MVRFGRRLLTLFVAFGALAGCGGGSDSTATASTPSITPTSPAAPNPAPAASTNDTPPAPTPGSANAAAICGGFDFFYTVGNKAQVSFRLTGALSGSEDWTITPIGNATFEGQATFQVNVDTTVAITGMTAFDVLDKQFTTRNGRASATVHGWEQVRDGSTSRTILRPPMPDARWSLAPGQSQLRTYHAEVQAVNGSTATVISASDFSTTDTFVGVESITVPAGTFETCRFDERHSSGATDTLWLLVGTTVPVKFETKDAAKTMGREATKVLVNGTPP